MLLIIIIILLIFIGLLFFVLPKLSPIPYFPSQKKDRDIILKALGLKNNQMIIDLGAGDGWVIFEAAKWTFGKKLNTQFIAVEINPILFITLHLKRFFHKNKKNIRLVFGDMFKLNYKNLLPRYKTELKFYLYISPWLMEKAANSIKKYCPNFYIISYMYALPKRKEVRKMKGKNNIFVYKF